MVAGVPEVRAPIRRQPVAVGHRGGSDRRRCGCVLVPRLLLQRQRQRAVLLRIDGRVLPGRR